MSGLFSPSIFLIVLRETLESGLIISVLLSFTSQLIKSTPDSLPLSPSPSTSALLDQSADTPNYGTSQEDAESEALLVPPSSSRGGERHEEKSESDLLRSMNIQIWFGAACGLGLSLLVGAVSILIFFETLGTTFSLGETLWEGIFSVISSLFILATGLSFVKLDRARVKWRIKLAAAFQDVDGGKGGRWALWFLPFVTVLREGLEGVVFITGVGLADGPSSIPLSILGGIVVGGVVLLFFSRVSARGDFHHFIVWASIFLFLVGAGLFSRGVAKLESYPFIRGVGGDVSESGEGPGSYDVRGNVWHFNGPGLSPDIKTNGWAMVAAAVCGWSNNATYLSIGSYCSYWYCVAGFLVYMKHKEGRYSFPWEKDIKGKGRERS